MGNQKNSEGKVKKEQHVTTISLCGACGWPGKCSVH